MADTAPKTQGPYADIARALDRIQPGREFDCNVGLEEVPDGYRAMDARESIKVMVTP